MLGTNVCVDESNDFAKIRILLERINIPCALPTASNNSEANF
jgi:hypothetical protein